MATQLAHQAALMKSAKASPKRTVQRKSGSPGGLPGPLKAGIERLSGLSMDGVRVHRNSSQPAQLNALAYAQGNDIHVGPGQDKHLPHEAWHVVQQAQGRVKPTVQMKAGVPVNDDPALEHEADVMGARAAQMAEPPASPPPPPTPPVQAAATAQRKVNAKWATASKPTVVTQKDGSSVSVNESDGVVAEVKPADYDSGSVTTDKVRTISRAVTSGFGVSFIAGHMLNKHLGGPGDEQENIAAISSRQNSQHHSTLEKEAKAAVKAGHTINYETKIAERANFTLTDSSGTVTAANLASKLQGSFISKDHTLTGKTTIDLGPPNAKKNGAAAVGGVDKTQEAALDLATRTIDFWHDQKYVIANIDEDNLKDFVWNLALKTVSADKWYALAKGEGYLK